jgi:hypothetical protein
MTDKRVRVDLGQHGRCAVAQRKGVNYRWLQAHYPRVEGFQTRTREVNFVARPHPPPVTGKKLCPRPSPAGTSNPRPHPCPPAARQQAMAPWDCKHIEPPPPRSSKSRSPLGASALRGRRGGGSRRQKKVREGQCILQPRLTKSRSQV